MRPRLPDRGTFARPVIVFLCVSVLVASCSTPPTGPPSAPGPSPAVSVLPPASGASPAPTGSTNAPTPSPSPAPPFVPEAVSVTLDPVASVAGGPLAFAAPRDGSGRLFVGAKDGRVWILDGGSVSSSALLDIRTLVSTGGEQGLLGIAVHPDFPTDPRVFVDYTDTGGDTVVASFRISAGDPGRLDPGDRKSTRLNSSHIQKSRMPSSA